MLLTQLGMVKSSGLLGLGSLSCFLAVNLSRGFVTKTGLSITAVSENFRPVAPRCVLTFKSHLGPALLTVHLGQRLT